MLIAHLIYRPNGQRNSATIRREIKTKKKNREKWRERECKEWEKKIKMGNRRRRNGRCKVKTFCYAQFYVLKTNWAAVFFVRRHFTKHITLMGRNIVTFVFPHRWHTSEYDMVLAMAIHSQYISIVCIVRTKLIARTRIVRRKIIFRFIFLLSNLAHLTFYYVVVFTSSLYVLR